MLESIFVGMSGLLGYSQGLRVIANNTANLNTPGFKGASLQFADMFYEQSALAGNGAGLHRTQLGYGLSTHSTTLNFKQGELRQTDSELDVAVDGQGLFMLRSADGDVYYTRAGQFAFNANGLLVNRTDGSSVIGLDASNAQSEISIAGLRTHPAQATSTVTFGGNLSSTEATRNLSDVRVIDSAGGEHSLTLTFTRNAAPAQSTWTITLADGSATVGTGTIEFVNGRPTEATSRVSFNYAPPGQDPQELTLDFSSEVTSFAAGTTSTLASIRQDGVLPGTITKVSFDDEGVLVVTYSNGETTKGATLSLAKFNSVDTVEAAGNNQFRPTGQEAWQFGRAGSNGFGSIRAGTIEISNVDLSQEFSNLVIMQRGYQASSQVISTANDMLQELFSMKGRR